MAKFWSEMLQRLTMRNSDIVMVGNPDTGKPEYTTFENLSKNLAKSGGSAKTLKEVEDEMRVKIGDYPYENTYPSPDYPSMTFASKVPSTSYFLMNDTIHFKYGDNVEFFVKNTTASGVNLVFFTIKGTTAQILFRHLITSIGTINVKLSDVAFDFSTTTDDIYVGYETVAVNSGGVYSTTNPSGNWRTVQKTTLQTNVVYNANNYGLWMQKTDKTVSSKIAELSTAISTKAENDNIVIYPITPLNDYDKKIFATKIPNTTAVFFHFEVKFKYGEDFTIYIENASSSGVILKFFQFKNNEMVVLHSQTFTTIGRYGIKLSEITFDFSAVSGDIYIGYETVVANSGGVYSQTFSSGWYSYLKSANTYSSMIYSYPLYIAKVKSDLPLRVRDLEIKGDVFTADITSLKKQQGRKFNPFEYSFTSFNNAFPTTPITKRNALTATAGNSLRIPQVFVTSAGTVLTSAEDRISSASDYARKNFVLNRMTTTGDETTIELFTSTPDWEVHQNNQFVQDITGAHGVEGRIFLFVYRWKDSSKTGLEQLEGEYGLVYVYSDDDGVTWSEPVPVKDAPTRDGELHINYGGVANGYQQTDGALILPVVLPRGGSNSNSAILYKQVGKEWTLSSPTPYNGDNECTAFEGSDNEILLETRTFNTNLRNLYRYDIASDEWTFHEAHGLFVPYQNCQGSIIRTNVKLFFLGTWYTKQVWLRSFTDSTGFAINNSELTRDNPSVWITDDLSKGWIRCYVGTKTHVYGYSVIHKYGDKIIFGFEVQGANIEVHDISNMNGELYRFAAQILNLPLEERMQLKFLKELT